MLFLKRYVDDHQACEKMLNNANNSRNENPNNNVRMAIIKRSKDNKYWQDVGRREHLYTVDGDVNWCIYCGKQYRGSTKY